MMAVHEPNAVYRLLRAAGITVKRARDRYLYTDDGCRILDMCLDSGRLVLGRKTGKSQLIFKNLVEQGAVSSFPSVQLCRFERAVVKTLIADNVLPPDTVCLGAQNALLPAVDNNAVHTFVAIRYYRTYRELWSALFSSVSSEKNTDTMLYTWMPFLPSTDSLLPSSLYVPNPLPLAEAPYTALFTIQGTYSDAASHFDVLPVSGSFSPAVLGASARAFDDLCAALHDVTDEEWAVYDKFLLKYWTRSGAWLYPNVSQTEYPAFVAECLKKNILISPEYTVPSLVPLGAGTGELRKL